jgi:phosphate transport system substrate-binding protein
MAVAALGLGLPVIAGLVWWLAAMPASAQPKPEESAAAAPPASADLTGRKQLLIVGPMVMKGLTEAIIKRLSAAYVLPPPIERFETRKAAMVAFCAGVGPQHPDIIAATDRMDPAEFAACSDNKVLDIIEVEFGDSALVVITKKGDQVFDLTPRMVYTALAEETPIKGEFKVNQKQTWNETDKNAPNLPIRVIVPAEGSGTRRFFDDDFMEGGCRHVKEIDAIFAAAERVPRCITLRDDGPAVTAEENQVVDALMKAPPGTLAVVGWLAYIENKDKLDTLPIDGVLPTHENIADDSYPMNERLRYYFKRANMETNLGGGGVVEGIPEFMAEIVSDQAAGEGGYLEKQGLVALEPQERSQQQNVVRRLKRFQP